MSFHPFTDPPTSRGALFENLVVVEFLKARLNRGLPPDMYFWRDSRGLEVGLFLEKGEDPWPVEIKAGQTIAPDFCAALKKWCSACENGSGVLRTFYGHTGEHALNLGLE
jgi:uncharacterized protein